MPQAVHRAPRQVVHGECAAQRLGTTGGLIGGALLAADEITSSPDAMRIAPDVFSRYAAAPTHAVGLLTRPLRAAGSGLASGLAALHPALDVGVHLPAKLADIGVAGYGVAVDKLTFADVRALLLRLPAAAYPAACEAEAPAAGCPDPLSYLRSAEVAPYLYGAGILLGAYVAVGPAVGLMWRTLAPTLALLPAELAEARLPSWANPLAARLIGHAQQAALELAEQAQAVDVEQPPTAWPPDGAAHQRPPGRPAADDQAIAVDERLPLLARVLG